MNFGLRDTCSSHQAHLDGKRVIFGKLVTRFLYLFIKSGFVLCYDCLFVLSWMLACERFREGLQDWLDFS